MLDENATIISPDRLLSLFAQMCLENHPQKEIVFDVKCSQMVANTVQQLGGQAKMIRTGSSFLRTYLTQSNGAAVFGGEYAGHYVSMMVVVLVMMMVYMLHYVLWNISPIQVQQIYLHC